MEPPVIERASAVDMMELASATTPAAGQVGAVLVMAHPPEFGLLRSTLAERICGIPRLRQRLMSTPFGCGRPIWVDDQSFDIAHHVDQMRCPVPGDRHALFVVVADLVARRLAPEQPLWSATLVTGLNDDTAALVLIFHHVMADGIGGLAVLANLVDGALVPTAGVFPRSAPRTMALLTDAMSARIRSIVHVRQAFRRLREAAAELGTSRRGPQAPRCSLNSPVGPRRCLAVVRTGLDGVQASAHRHGATVNDAALAAIACCLTHFLSERREHVDHVVVSIPVSARKSTTVTSLGNKVGVMLAALPATVAPASTCIEAIAAETRARKQAPSGASAAILAPAFRILAATRTLNWLTRHQRLTTTFVTNLRGPDHPVALLGATVNEIIPVNGTSGNVRVAFGVFSYANALTITVVADADFAHELPALVARLQIELDEIVADGHRAALRPDCDVTGTDPGSSS